MDGEKSDDENSLDDDREAEDTWGSILAGAEWPTVRADSLSAVLCRQRYNISEDLQVDTQS